MRREQIFARDDYVCVYCGEQFEPELLTIDHVQPRVRGGDRSGGNLVTACGGCNARKGSLRIAEFLRTDDVARAHFFRLARPHVWPRIMRAVDDKPVWSIVCSFVGRDFRGRGVQRRLLSAAIDFARDEGVRTLEAYPVDKPGRTADSNLWFGTKSMFDAAGFEEVARRKPERPVVRLHVGS